VPSLVSWILLLLLGRLVIYVWMIFHLPKWMKNEWMEQLHGCDLCSGIWIYTILSFFLEVDLLDELGFGYIPVLGALITGIVISWLVHIFILGWKAKYEIVVV
jgi:hypothetical protein